MRPVAVRDPDCNDSGKAVQRVELGRLAILAGDQPRSEPGLGKDRELGRDRARPQRLAPERGLIVGGQRPKTYGRIRSDHNPREPVVSITRRGGQYHLALQRLEQIRSDWSALRDSPTGVPLRPEGDSKCVGRHLHEKRVVGDL